MKKIIASVTSILLALLMVLFLVGCNETKEAEKVVNKAFAELKSANVEGASQYLDVDDIFNEEETFDFEDNFLVKNLFGKLSHKINSSEKIDENTVVVNTTITAIDIEPVFTEFFAQALQYAFANAFADPQPSDEEVEQKMEEIFIECVSKEDLAMQSTDVAITVVKTDGSWEIDTSDAIADALLPGLEEAIEEISNSLNVED